MATHYLTQRFTWQCRKMVRPFYDIAKKKVKITDSLFPFYGSLRVISLMELLESEANCSFRTRAFVLIYSSDSFKDTILFGDNIFTRVLPLVYSVYYKVFSIFEHNFFIFEVSLFHVAP